MIRRISVLFIIFILIASFSCQKKNDNTNTEWEAIVGVWVNPHYIDSIISFEKSDELIDNSYGLSILSNHKIVERKNAGSCGTPPIAYADFKGFWVKNNSKLIINVEFWGGKTDLLWEIISVDNTQLTVLRIEEKYGE